MTSPIQIIKAVADATGIRDEIILGRRKTEAVVLARYVALAQVRMRHPEMSHLELAGEFHRTKSWVTQSLRTLDHWTSMSCGVGRWISRVAFQVDRRLATSREA